MTGTSAAGGQNDPLAGVVRGVPPWVKAGIITDRTRPGSAYAAVMVTGGDGVGMQRDYVQDPPRLLRRRDP